MVGCAHCAVFRSSFTAEHPSIPRDLFQSPLALAQAELDQLVLHSAELEKFLAYKPQLGRLFLKLDGKAPTALHSWGSQMVGCHCGCRTCGFSHETLSSRGVYGLLIPLPELGSASDSSLPMLRHPHPTEVALLNGVPEITWPCDLRLALAGLGQMAAPFQTLWVGAHLQKHVDFVFHGSSTIDPQDMVERLSSQMFQLVDALSFLPAQPVDLPEPPVMDLEIAMDDITLTPWVQFQHLGHHDEVTVVHDSDRVPYVVKLSALEETVAAVISASAERLDFDNVGLRVLDCSSGLDVRLDHPAAGMCLWFTKKGPQVSEDVVAFHAEHDAISPTVAWIAEEPQNDSACEVPTSVPEPASASVGPNVLEPLTSLDAERLLLVSEPSVTDCALMDALGHQTMSASARKQILSNQGTVWADDEMWFHMHQMLSAANKPSWAVIDPLLCAEAIKRPSAGLIGQWIRSLDFKPSAILGVVCADQHWTPFLWTWTPHCTIAASWDVPGSPNRGFSVLHQAIATAVGSRTFTVHVVHRKFAVDRLCGICAIRFIDSMLRGKMLPTADDEAFQLHAIGRSLFVAHLDTLDTVPRPWIFGAGLDPMSSDRLHSLLSDHGVDQSQVKQRAALLIQAIGLAATQQAVTSGQPWRALKAAANHCRPPFQIVLPVELEAVVSKKAAQGGMKTKKKGGPAAKKAPSKPEPPVGLDPSKLSIEEGSFTTQKGSPIKQIGLSDIGPFVSGIVLCTTDQATAYLRANQLVSNGALGLLLLNADTASLPTTLTWSSLRVILRCQANGEPLLAPACLVQIGHLVVTSKPSGDISDALHEPAACLKVAIYRDSVEDWDSVVRAPVKYLLAHLLPLQSCRPLESDPPCVCAKWHPSKDSCVEEPVVDVWRRQWVSSTFQPCAADRADIFMVNLRCLESQFEAALGLSGRNGLFLEPRSLDAKEPHLDYQVLWFPKTDVAELLRRQQCHAGVLGLARIGSRLGLRVRLHDAPGLAQTLKPGTVFLASGSRVTYELGPLPFGCDRLTVSKLCEGQASSSNTYSGRIPGQYVEGPSMHSSSQERDPVPRQ